jgi:hypothetical protein
MSFEEGSGENQKTSRYNSAVDQIRRLGNIWDQVITAVKSGNFLMWNILLDRVWAELAGDLTDDDKSEDSYNDMNTKLVQLQPLLSTNLQTFNKKPVGFDQKISKQYQLLMTKEIFIRRLQNKLGKGTFWDDGSDSDFD